MTFGYYVIWFAMCFAAAKLTQEHRFVFVSDVHLFHKCFAQNPYARRN